jgi:hypothetical protein
VLVQVKSGADLYYVSGPDSGWYKMSTPYGLEGYIKASQVVYDRHLTPSETHDRLVTEQLFRIKKVMVDTKQMSVNVTAEHVSYDMSGVLMEDIKIVRKPPAQALAWLAPALLFYSANMLLTRVCYATDDVRSPLISGAVSIAVNIAVSKLLLNSLAAGGLALANTLGAAVNMLILLLMLRPQLQGLFASMRGDTLKMSAAGLLMAAVCLAARPLLPLGSRAALGVWLLGLIGAACLLYFVVLKLLHCSMLDEMLGMLKRKVKKA